MKTNLRWLRTLRHRLVHALVAARAIRRRGYDGTGVADIMKEAVLTHGAFYSHFASCEAMLAEAAGRACAESAAAAADVVSKVPPGSALASRRTGAHEQALVTLSTMVGALLLARAVDDPGLSDSLREAALKHLLPAAH